MVIFTGKFYILHSVPVILFWKLKQKDCFKFEANLGYIVPGQVGVQVRSCLKQNKSKENG